jgi:hypothetical protein
VSKPALLTDYPPSSRRLPRNALPVNVSMAAHPLLLLPLPLLLLLLLGCTSPSSSASLLLPRPSVLREHLSYCLQWPWTSLKLRILCIDVCHLVSLPFFLALWRLDELLYPAYKTHQVKAPVILVSAPRTGR